MTFLLIDIIYPLNAHYRNDPYLGTSHHFAVEQIPTPSAGRNLVRHTPERWSPLFVSRCLRRIEGEPTPIAPACRTVQLMGGDREDEIPLVADLACPSCGAPATGRYCAQCGERFLRPRDFELRHFLSEHVAHEMLEFDGKLPRSLRILLTQPGQLALEYVTGHRKPFLSPLRLYLVTFLLHLFLLSFLAPHPLTMPEIAKMFDPSGFLSRLMASRGSIDWTGSQPREHFLERVHWISQALTLLVFLGVAGIQSLLLMRLRRHYLEHLSLALNVSAFYLLLCVAGDVVAALFWHREMQQAA
jgi:hypothetical protein